MDTFVLEDSEIQKLGFQFLNTVILQIIIIASALLTFTVTFAEKLKYYGNVKSTKHWLIFSWILLIASIFLGFISLYRLTGALIFCNYKILNEALNYGAIQFFLFSSSLLSFLIFALNSTIKIKTIIGLIKKNNEIE